MDGETPFDLIIELRVAVGDLGGLEVSKVYNDGAGTQFARLGLYPGLRVPDMGGQCYDGTIIMLKKGDDGENVSYSFYYNIISDKRIFNIRILYSTRRRSCT